MSPSLPPLPIVLSSFWSTLLSTVLTFHVNWLHSFVSRKADAFDCGTRVLVLSRDKSLAERLLYVLSYFVRAVDATGENDSEPMLVAAAAAAASAENPHTETVNGHNREARSDPTDGDVIRSKEARLASRHSSAGFAPAHESLSTSFSLNGVSKLVESCRRGSSSSSQQMENARYLRNYYDVRFQLSPDTRRDGATFANVKYSIAKNGFQDFSLHDLQQETTAAIGSLSTPAPAAAAFFVGSVPDRSASCGAQQDRRPSPADSTAPSGHAAPLPVPIPRFCAFFIIFFDFSYFFFTDNFEAHRRVLPVCLSLASYLQRCSQGQGQDQGGSSLSLGVQRHFEGGIPGRSGGAGVRPFGLLPLAVRAAARPQSRRGSNEECFVRRRRY